MLQAQFFSVTFWRPKIHSNYYKMVVRHKYWLPLKKLIIKKIIKNMLGGISHERFYH